MMGDHSGMPMGDHSGMPLESTADKEKAYCLEQFCGIFKNDDGTCNVNYILEHKCQAPAGDRDSKGVLCKSAGGASTDC